jgi:regulator of replication initiation timing
MTTTTKYAEIEQRIDRAISDLERIKQIARSLDEENAALRAAWSADVARLKQLLAACKDQ